ncbi:MAG: KGG domain-containing protein [Ferruginibacter sp.]
MSNLKDDAEKTTGSKRGFASMDQAKQREVSSKGGKAAHVSGRAHQFDSEEARAAGKKGGSASSRNRESSRDDIIL